MDDYRSWTKVDWTNPGLGENSVDKMWLDENRLDQNELDEK